MLDVAVGRVENPPGIGPIMSDVEKADPIARKPSFRALIRPFPELMAALAGSVMNMHDHAAQTRYVELVVFRRQLDAPATYCAAEFEGR
jgi:hypothetical protein